jgi:hypothetical protein
MGCGASSSALKYEERALARAEERTAGRPPEHAWTRRDVSTAQLLERVEASQVSEKPRKTGNDSNNEAGGDQTAVDEGAAQQQAQASGADWDDFEGDSEGDFEDDFEDDREDDGA